MFIYFKATFLAKHMQLMQNWRNQVFLARINEWIDDNIEDMYMSFMITNPTQ